MKLMTAEKAIGVHPVDGDVFGPLRTRQAKQISENCWCRYVGFALCCIPPVYILRPSGWVRGFCLPPLSSHLVLLAPHVQGPLMAFCVVVVDTSLPPCIKRNEDLGVLGRIFLVDFAFAFALRVTHV